MTRGNWEKKICGLLPGVYFLLLLIIRVLSFSGLQKKMSLLELMLVKFAQSFSTFGNSLKHYYYICGTNCNLASVSFQYRWIKTADTIRIDCFHTNLGIRSISSRYVHEILCRYQRSEFIPPCKNHRCSKLLLLLMILPRAPFSSFLVPCLETKQSNKTMLAKKTKQN